MANNTNSKNKFKKDDKKQISLGVEVLVKAYAYMKKGSNMINAINKTLKKYDVRDIAILPRPEALVGHLKILSDAADSMVCPEGNQRGWQIVIRDAYNEIMKGQVSVNELCPQEDTASQCDEKPENEENQICDKETEDDDQPTDDKKEDNKRDPIHDMMVAHTALVICRVQTMCESWHLDNDKVTMTLSYDNFFKLCKANGINEELRQWASQF